MCVDDSTSTISSSFRSNDCCGSGRSVLVQNPILHSKIMIPSRRSVRSTVMVTVTVAMLALFVLLPSFTVGFAPSATTSTTTTMRSFTPAALNALGKKKGKEDLSFIESRDMTREEMMELNKKNEDIMNMELQAMTGFSLILSLPILYLCWVAFFSD
jgi:hypothetical protein